MKKQIPSFMPHKASLATKSMRVPLLLAICFIPVGQAAAFGNGPDCAPGDFACPMASVSFDGNFARYISLVISGREGPATAFRGNGIAIGNDARAGENLVEINKSVGAQVAIGLHSRADGLSSVALGARTQTSGTGAIALGRGSTSDGEGASALGDESFAVGRWTLALGYRATTGADHAVAIGQTSVSQTLGGIAIGSSASVESMSEFGLALGRRASVKDAGKNAVALGNESIADRPNSVSVGAPGKPRQITNVADGVDDSDVVTVGQLKKLGLWAE